MINIKKAFLFVFSMVIITLPAYAKPSWDQWLKAFRQEAIAAGVSPTVFDQAFEGVRPDPRTVSFDRKQPEQRLTYQRYRDSRGDNYRITLGRKKLAQNDELLQRIGREYGVDPCIITSLWGIESSYGHYMGTFPVIKSLATLAYDDRRAAFFRKELLYALRILDNGDVTMDKFVGEWAGGSGQPQFLPSSWFRYAVDYDGDGKKDIWSSKPDVFASIANYLKLNGWQSYQPWYVEVEVPKQWRDIPEDEWHPVAYWLQQGVHVQVQYQLPSDDLAARLIKPYGGPYLLVFKNFDVIKRYNNSTFYAGTVGYIANKICRRL